jgi:hypothetical protein
LAKGRVRLVQVVINHKQELLLKAKTIEWLKIQNLGFRLHSLKHKINERFKL